MPKRVLYIAGLLLVTFLPSIASAANETVVTASPSSVKLTLAAGSTYSGSVQITIRGSDSVQVKAYAEPFSVSGEDYKQSFVFQPGAVDASRWFNIDPAPRTAKAGQPTLFPYTIKVPNDVGPGGYYATFFAQTVADKSLG